MLNDDRDSRSLSQDYDSDNDPGDGRDETGAPGKPGRKKNPNSAAARRDQNRIAQREFRLRKQQRIRDLEARVEILSGSKDETFSELRNIVRDLMQENLQLRGLIRSLGGYIGDGMGGVLPSLGFDRPQDFIDYVNRAETDTAFEGFQRRKKAAQAASAAAGPNGLSASLSRKRTVSEDDGLRKRAKGLGETSQLTMNGKDHDSQYPMLVPISPATGSGGAFYSSGGANTTSAMYMTGPTVADSPNYAASPGMSSGVQFPSAFQTTLNVQNALNSQAFLASTTVPNPSVSGQGENNDSEDSVDDPKLQEATKLIHYHLDNYKRNNAYCLPQSLRPTLVQRTVPHESVIDSIPHPELRDRLILLRTRFDLVDALHDYAKNLTLHGDDVLAHNNWEIGESWIRQYHFLVDQSLLNISNRWRRERGEPELSMADINPPDVQAT